MNAIRSKAIYSRINGLIVEWILDVIEPSTPELGLEHRIRFFLQKITLIFDFESGLNKSFTLSGTTCNSLSGSIISVIEGSIYFQKWDIELSRYRAVLIISVFCLFIFSLIMIFFNNTRTHIFKAQYISPSFFSNKVHFLLISVC